MKNKLDLGEVYTTNQAAKLLGIGAAAVRKACRTGTMKSKIFNRTYMISGSAIADYREKHLGKFGQKIDIDQE